MNRFAVLFRLRVPALALLFCLLLSGCLNITTSISVDRKGRVEASLVYEMEAWAAEFGRGFGSDEPWPFPLTEKDFRLRALEVPGTEITRYRVRKKDGRETVSVKLRADNLPALCACLGVQAEFDMSAKEGYFTASFPGREEFGTFSSRTREALQQVLADSSLTFRFRPPRAPAKVSSGRVEGPWAVADFPLEDMLLGHAPAEWTVRW